MAPSNDTACLLVIITVSGQVNDLLHRAWPRAGRQVPACVRSFLAHLQCHYTAAMSCATRGVSRYELMQESLPSCARHSLLKHRMFRIVPFCFSMTGLPTLKLVQHGLQQSSSAEEASKVVTRTAAYRSTFHQIESRNTSSIVRGTNCVHSGVVDLWAALGLTSGVTAVLDRLASGRHCSDRHSDRR